VNKIKNNLISDVVSIMQNAFAGEEKGWYNFRETNR
jgi:hypothetical protein